MDRKPFLTRLAAVIDTLENHQFLILAVKRSGRYVQFSAQGSEGLWVETTSNGYLSKREQLDEDQIAAMIDAGWHPPLGTPDDMTDGSPNYFMDFNAPVSSEDVARLTVHTFSRILRVPHPGRLEYKAFSKNGKSLSFPELELRMARSW